MNDLQKKSVEELKKLEEESRAELFALKFQAAMGSLEKPHRISELRKQIARILTVLATRKNSGENVNVNVKVNLSETYSKIEKESQAYMKEKRAQFEKMMAEKNASEDNKELFDLQLPIENESDKESAKNVELNKPQITENTKEGNE